MRQTIQFQLLFLTLATIGLLVFTCCPEEELPCNDETNVECLNYDPCWDRETLTADFKMEVPIRVGRMWGVADTTVLMPVYPEFAPGKIIFSALEENADSYYWQIGNNPDNDRFTKSFTLSFPCGFQGETIPIKLITERITDTICPEWNMARDTVEKQITLVRGADNTLVEGRFEGYLERYPDETYTIDVRINHECELIGCICFDSIYQIYNLLNFDCGAVYPHPTAIIVHNALLSSGSTTLRRERDGCPFPEGIETIQASDLLIRIYSEDSIRIDVEQKYFPELGQPGTIVRTETFIGTRVN